MQSAIRLFKAVPITQKGKAKASRTLLKETIKRGFVFSPEVIFNYSQNELDELIKQLRDIYGIMLFNNNYNLN